MSTDNNHTEKKPYWTGHRERLRRRAKAGGLEALRPHEVLELLLGYVVPRVDLSDVTRALIDAFGSVEAVLDADRQRLMAVPGMTRRMADWLLSTGELVSAYRGVSHRSQIRIWRFRDVMAFLSPRWRAIPPPQMWVIYTDYDDRVLCCMKVSDSLSCDSPACSREIMENALAQEARYVYLVGFAGIEPLELYPEEIEYLQSLSGLMSAIDVQLMDCVLVGEQGWFSANREGLLSNERQAPAFAQLRERYLSGDEVIYEGTECDAGYCALHEDQPGAL